MSYFQLSLPGRWIDVVTVVITLSNIYPANIYLLKVTIETIEKGQIYSTLTIKTPEWCQWRRSGVFIVNFEYISEMLTGYASNKNVKQKYLNF